MCALLSTFKEALIGEETHTREVGTLIPPPLDLPSKYNPPTTSEKDTELRARGEGLVGDCGIAFLERFSFRSVCSEKSTMVGLECWRSPFTWSWCTW